jgi:hypothetical protein
MQVDNLYAANFDLFLHEADLLATVTRGIEKKIALFDGVCWYAALSFIARCIFVSRTTGCRGCTMNVVLHISDIVVIYIVIFCCAVYTVSRTVTAM